MRVHYASSVAVKLSAEVISASFKSNLFLQVSEQFLRKSNKIFILAPKARIRILP